jgi:hypothetical protein
MDTLKWLISENSGLSETIDASALYPCFKNAIAESHVDVLKWLLENLRTPLNREHQKYRGRVWKFRNSKTAPIERNGMGWTCSRAVYGGNFGNFEMGA